ncbi:MAG: SIS domain-containing protein [Spirochaetes bacterium]|nr:SIS domain-containing protein [Spirochaetota bacterium]MBU0955567.1 SIS domain-containing protein [Spirochaetota bacterium]
MCGIVSLVYKDESKNMGQEAAELLKRLEYRGYDSTGASFIDKDRNIVVVKRVGSPTKVCRDLNIPGYSGQRFIGQVRWATYGAVTDTNSQPHHVRCKVEMVGAHNGNISNTDSLKQSLTARGHLVKSDNDGEIIVHLVEEYYAANSGTGAEAADAREAVLAEAKQRWQDAAAGGKLGGVHAPAGPLDDRNFLIIDAIRKAEAEAEGSYAAAVADPQVPGCFAMKSGSSLYAGIGEDSNGRFVVVSSDLTSVLTKTRLLIPLVEGQGLWYCEDRYVLFPLHGELRFSSPDPKRSRLDVSDISLDPKYKYFMEQEIYSSPANADEIARFYFDDPAQQPLAPLFASVAELPAMLDEGSAASACADDRAFAAAIAAVLDRPGFAALYAAAGKDNACTALINGRQPADFRSSEAQLLLQADRLLPGRRLELALLDLAYIWRKRTEIKTAFGQWTGYLRTAKEKRGRVYFLASGTSYHAALTASYFFGDLAGLPVYPCNPGLMRSAYLNGLGADDLVIAISQSGETKDLVDILQEIAERSPALKRLSLVNNENSRIPQELSDLYLPLLCGPETAVAATKSFINQLLILYIMAAGFVMDAGQLRGRIAEIRDAMQACLQSVPAALGAVAEDLFMKPSLHLLGTGLIGLAKEGALKIREVVLNHSEGYDTAEFKHGPNTILGKNTLFSFTELERGLDWLLDALRSGRLTLDAAGRSGDLLAARPELAESLFSDYPLVFVCPPEERDTKITISQIHTHKIRGAQIVLFAEPDRELKLAAEGKPAGNEGYKATVVELPRTGDRHTFVFTATIALQLLALRMSERKMAWLDAHGIADHGVHPDVPKNVSKSITVD